MQKPFFIGITGGSGSGKTHFLNMLLDAFDPSEICVISQDNYYFPIEEQQKDQKGIENFDRPESIDSKRFARDIEALREGKTVELVEYLFNNNAKTPKTFVLKPAPIIIIEGIFTLYFEEVAQYMDLKVFIDTKDILMLKRRIMRDAEERGYDLADVLYRYEYHVEPAFEKYIRPYKFRADLIIPNNHNHSFDNALEVVKNFLKTKL
ncbi:MAG: uridine kinase [bacterium]|nr:uridine kinase [bacterium]